MNETILVVDDEPDMRSTLVRYLTSEGFNVSAASDGQELNRALALATFDLVILDLGLRNETGLDLLKKLRETLNIAVIILTGKSDPVDRVVGLELGADDYVTKPFLNRELLARIKAVLRRSNKAPVLPPLLNRGDSRSIIVNGWQIDLVVRTLKSPSGEAVTLTSAEFDILVEMAENAGKAVTRDRLMEVAHRRSWSPEDRSIDVHVHNLRKKLTDPASPSDIIVAVRNVGYVLAAEVAFS